MTIFGIDLGEVFTPDVNLLEIVLRGVLMYLAILVLLRVLLRGRTGTSLPDILVLVLIADAAQNAMAAQYNSFTSGLVLVAAIIGSSSALDWLAYRVPAIGRYVNPQRKPLVVNGRIIRTTLNKELMTEDELMTQLHLNGVDEISEVKAAYLEPTGEVSVIKAGGESAGKGG